MTSEDVSCSATPLSLATDLNVSSRFSSRLQEMKRPEDFPKALYAVTAAEFALFLTVGIIVYYYSGQYTEAPAVAVLSSNFKKAAFSFVLPTTIIIGIIVGIGSVTYCDHRLWSVR